MDRDHPNPYRESTLRQLFAALNQRAGELLKGDSPVGRRDTAHLLLAASKRVDCRAVVLGSPASRVQQGTRVTDAYLPEYEADLRALWYHTLQHAMDAVGLSHTDVLARQASTGLPFDACPRTDAEFRAALQWLEEAHLASHTTATPPPV